jgi:3-hydroxyisobutyrate dehydrogenase-like beta-hydroxyacid dehydrogenase
MKPPAAVLGLGRMGAALARALAAGGLEVTVWNRSPARAYALEREARVARSPGAACAGAGFIVLSLSDYSAGMEVMDAATAEADLGRKVLVQLTSGSPTDARTMHAWARMQGLRYLDAAIVGYPQNVGTPAALLFVAGDEAAYEECRDALALLGTVHFVGEAPGAAAALDCAVLEYYYGATLAMLHGAALCESEALPLAPYFNIVKALAPLLTTTADAARTMIDRELYAGTECTLDVHVAALRHIQRMSHDNEVEPRFPDTLMHAYRRALGAGHGSDEIASVFEVLRRHRD